MTPLLIALLFAGPTTGERPMITQPAWVQRPSAEDIGRVTPFLEHPPAEVHVLMVCRITPAGGLEACSIKSEDPPGLGYGPAALAVSQFFKLPPVDELGRPVAGRMVQIPILWKLAPD